MNTINLFKKYSLVGLLASGCLFTSCDSDDVVPEIENELEVITDVKLIFTNTADDTDVVTATAQDPDGPGLEDLVIKDAINLGAGKTYTLTYEIMNKLEEPGEDIGEEILDEDDEHQFFFGFTEDAFSNPTGNGNIDNASDDINYEDEDDNGNPVGLETTWTASATSVSNGEFRVVLKHQPDVKTATSGFNDGDTDFDLKFVLNIQ
ncbi:GTP cyclohydrolase [Flammeovirga sp. EKP202]|uniref:GTP cyclohydrolase n=1 Tax=Flammeovirga sp. EKP202 TaxID=2770592 RepID=UPI00165EF89F|nr:GTP cyclohydrolase [Flammeovirga sp. EKP202]MBD0402450.1 GTP cyclohydrolase [Flammeovirga sp. EKP202]